MATPTQNETLKLNCPTLAGSIARTMADPGSDRFSEDDVQFLKFHGIYQQDDRDRRKAGKKFIFMVRLRIPGGVLSPAQYLACDDLATRYGNNTLRVTSRQSLQFHGTVKTGLGALIKGIHDALLTTLAACGDVNRNVMAPPAPALNGLGEQVRAYARQAAAALAPRTQAYHSIWVDGVELNLGSAEEQEFTDPLYGKTYLPRKFKIAFAIPPLNDVDIFANCCGFIAVVAGSRLAGFNLVAGGGMGRSHGNQATYPRLADVVGFVRPEHVVDTATAVLKIHRDFGDRTNRKHARLKYILEDKGVGWFRNEVETRLGFKLEEARPFHFEKQGDDFGWRQQADGRWYLGLFVETGRIKDQGETRLKTALREVIRSMQPEVRLTPSNNVLLVGIAPEKRDLVQRLFEKHAIHPEPNASAVRRASMACVALPTCGLALAESERYLPGFISQLEPVLDDLGLAQQEIIIRMTGCPNGCARPYLAEIGFVGKAPGRYQIYLGGDHYGMRLNRLYLDNVKDTDLIPQLRPLLARYAAERQGHERFGDWCARVVWPQQTVAAASVPPSA